MSLKLVIFLALCNAVLLWALDADQFPALGLAGSVEAPRPFTLIAIPENPNVWGVGAVHWSAVPGDDIGFGIVAEKFRPRLGPWREVDENGIPFGPWIGEADVAVLRLEAPAAVTPLEVVWHLPPDPIIVEAVYQSNGELLSLLSTATWTPDPVEWQTGYRFLHHDTPLVSGFPVLLDGKLLGVVVGGGETHGLCHPVSWVLGNWPDGFPVWDRRNPPIVVRDGASALVTWPAPANGWTLARSTDLNEWQPLVSTPLGGVYSEPITGRLTSFRLQRN